MSIPTNVQQQLELQIGDIDALEMAPYIESFWDSRAVKALIDPDLQQAYTLLDLVSVLLGNTWKLVDNAAGDEKIALSQKFKAVQQIHTNALVEIRRIEARANASRTISVGHLKTKTPVQPGPHVEVDICEFPDPSDRAYRGDPLRETVPTSPPF